MSLDWWEGVVEVGPTKARALGEARTRLTRLGARALTDAELVALVTDTPHVAAGALLRSGLRALFAEAPEQLLENRALKHGGAERLLAAAELARRVSVSQDARPRLSTPAAIYDYARAHLCGLRREEFHVLCVNSRNVLLRDVRVAEGSVDQCHVDPREALAPAVACRASGLVLVHNHPSGDPEPSVHDVALTRQLRDGARLLCLRLLDHLVIGDRGYVSMLARGYFTDDGAAVVTRLQSRGPTSEP